MNDHIKDIICITDNFGDGQKITACEIEYDKEIDGSWISAANYWVKDRNITDISVNGCRVKLALDIRDDQAGLLPAPGEPKKLDVPPIVTRVMPKGGPPRNIPETVRRQVQVTLRQVSEIKAADGELIMPADRNVTSSASYEPVVEDFRQFEYEGIPYNLFIPKGCDGTKKFPLVMFIHDAGPCGTDPLITLSQGSGAVSFAEPEWQAEHPCFVLAPQINRGIKLTNDNFTVSDDLEKLKRLLDSVADNWSIDRNRIYVTGQSMGCMASCELNIRYPDLFAASLLVAGQWSPEKMAEKCSGSNLWILVSEHDARAFPGMNAVIEKIEEAGTKTGRYYWDAKLSPEELDRCAREAMKDDFNIRYTVFNGSTVVPPWVNDSPGSNHTCTWQKVYPVRALKEWLFSCSK